MKYKKNKLRLNDIASAMQGFYFLVKFGLVLIYILKNYLKKSSSILLRKKYVESIACIIFLLKRKYLLKSWKIFLLKI